jgi:cell division protein FtsI (penicillin-binding protein 3)
MPYISSGKGEELQGILDELGVSAKSPSVEDYIKSSLVAEKVQLQINDTEKSVVPDVSGMPLRDALFVLENKGLKVNYTGKGRVLEQSMTPGSKLTPDATINLVLG